MHVQRRQRMRQSITEETENKKNNNTYWWRGHLHACADIQNKWAITNYALDSVRRVSNAHSYWIDRKPINIWHLQQINISVFINWTLKNRWTLIFFFVSLSVFSLSLSLSHELIYEIPLVLAHKLEYQYLFNFPASNGCVHGTCFRWWCLFNNHIFALNSICRQILI